MRNITDVTCCQLLVAKMLLLIVVGSSNCGQYKSPLTCVIVTDTHHRDESSSNCSANASNQSESVWPVMLPKEIDYRTLGYVSSVDKQDRCAACWAFSIVGAIEGLVKKRNGVLEKLSTQQIIDCTGGSNGCYSGLPIDAIRYAKRHGLELDCDYPYKDEQRDCEYNSQNIFFEFYCHEYHSYLTEKQLKAKVAKFGPIATAIVATQSFYEYKGGIFLTDQCNSEMNINHGILIVGYGYEGDKKYWIIKNSFGEEWGEHGFIRFERKIGLCKIGTDTIWPID